MGIPRLMIAGTGSSCGKTTITCALLRALATRGKRLSAFKCGPDYIDPMFHTEVTGVPCRNLDLFLMGEEGVLGALSRSQGDLAVIEGVMGYYDGVGESSFGSACHLSQVTDTPAVLVLGCKGMGLSIAAVVSGYQNVQENNIRGVIFNQISPGMYPYYKKIVEENTGLRAYGFLPPDPSVTLKSRHLGLVTAHETQELKSVLTCLGNLGARYLDLDGLLELAQSAGELPACPERELPSGPPVRVAVARDRAFSFYYADNLELLERLGAELCFFSPMKDEEIPQGCQGLILGGGYPELYGAALSDNHPMRSSVKRAVEAGMPTIAECGGFLYLQESLTGPDGRAYPMVGALPGRASMTKKLVRFGYLTLEAKEDSLLLAAGERIPAHEFHYSDSDCCGDGYLAQKPSGKCWECGVVNENLYAGYPHIHFGGNPQAAHRFLNRCRRFGGM